MRDLVPGDALLVLVAAVAGVLLWPGARSLGVTSGGRDGGAGADSASDGSRRSGSHRPGAGRRSPPRSADPREVADALVLVALCLRAGSPVVPSLERAAVTAGGRVCEDLRAVTAALRWGRSTAAAWGYAGPVWAPAALAFQMADSTGAGPADLIDAAAQRLREEHERDRERRAARAGVLLVLPLGFGFLPAFACTAVVPLVVVLAGGVLGPT
jgi:Type II secretion system (T2SS), protein F